MELLHRIRKTFWKKRCIAAVLALSVAIAGYRSVFASTIQDAQNKKNEAQENLDAINEQIDAINEAQSNLQEEMEAYDDMLMALLTDMELLESDMADKQVEIDQAAQEQEEIQYEAMKLRIQYMYENSDNSVWTAIAGATNITDLLNRVEYVTQVQDYDRKQLEAYQDTVQQVADLTDQLYAEMAEMEELEINYQEQQASLEGLIAEKSSQMDNFAGQLADAEALAGAYAATIREQNQIIADEEARIAAAAAAANNSSGGGNGLTATGLNPAYTTSVSGSDVVAYAKQFVGNPYVFGGNSLTEGCDCSYFVMACFKQYGISLPRNSYAMQKSGQAVSYDCAQAGDIICYSGHVALYMGNGQIVHASSPTKGICYGTATYRTIVTIRRVL